MSRFPDWPQRYHDYIDAVKRNQFDWVSFNCAHFCAGSIKAITGKDLLVGFKKAKSKAEFIKLIKAKGFKDLEELVNKKLPRKHKSKANVGDIAVFPSDDIFGVAFGIVNGDHIIVVSETGMRFTPLFDAEYVLDV